MPSAHSIGELAEDLGLTAAIISGAVKEMSPEFTSGSGRFKFYNIDKVKDALIERNKALLDALGYVDPRGHVNGEES